MTNPSSSPTRGIYTAPKHCATSFTAFTASKNTTNELPDSRLSRGVSVEAARQFSRVPKSVGSFVEIEHTVNAQLAIL